MLHLYHLLHILFILLYLVLFAVDGRITGIVLALTCIIPHLICTPYFLLGSWSLCSWYFRSVFDVHGKTTAIHQY